MNQSDYRTQSFLGTMFKMAVSINTQLVPDGSQEENAKFRQITPLSPHSKHNFEFTKLIETFNVKQNSVIFLLEHLFAVKSPKSVVICLNSSGQCLRTANDSRPVILKKKLAASDQFSARMLVENEHKVGLNNA